MAIIPYSTTEKQFDRVTRYVTDHSISSNSNNLIGYIAPTPKANRLKGEYNVTVPDLANSLLKLARKIDPAGAVGANGTGTKTSDLEVGQPVLVSFLGNKQQPVIWGSYPFSGTDSNFEIDKSLEIGSFYPPPRHPVLDRFSGQGEIAKLKLRSYSPTQSSHSPSQVEVPGSYKYFTDDGYSYEFSANNTIQSLAGLSTRVEGKRSSIITQPHRSSLKQSALLPYEINRDLNRVYRFVNGQFLPEEIREFPITELLFEYVDPLLEKIDLLNNFIIGADKYVQQQKEWFENSIIKPTENIIKVWKDVIDKKDIIGALGLTPLEFNFNVMGVLDKLFSMPSTGSAIADAALQLGAQWVKKKVSNLLDSTGLLDNIEFAGGLISIGFGGGGGSNGAKYSSDLGSLLSIKLPTIGAEGSPLYKTIKYVNHLDEEITSKANEIGYLTSSLSTFVEGFASMGNDLARKNRQHLEELKRKQAIKDARNESNNEFLNLIESETILQYDDPTEPSRLSEFLDEPEPSFLEVTGEIIRPVVEGRGLSESLYKLEEHITKDNKKVVTAEVENSPSNNQDIQPPQEDVIVDTVPISPQEDVIVDTVPISPQEDVIVDTVPVSPREGVIVDTVPISPLENPSLSPEVPGVTVETRLEQSNTDESIIDLRDLSVVGSIDSNGDLINQSSLLEIISESYLSVVVRAKTVGINSITFLASNDQSFSSDVVKSEGILRSVHSTNNTFTAIFNWEEFEDDKLFIKAKFNKYETEIISVSRPPINDYYYQYSCNIRLESSYSKIIKKGNKPSHSLVTQVQTQPVYFDPQTSEEIGRGRKNILPATGEHLIDISLFPDIDSLVHIALHVKILETGKSFFSNRVEYDPSKNIEKSVEVVEDNENEDNLVEINIEEFYLDWGADITILTILVEGNDEAYSGRIVIQDSIELDQSFTLSSGSNNIQLGQSLTLIESEEREFEVAYTLFVDGEVVTSGNVLVQKPGGFVFDDDQDILTF